MNLFLQLVSAASAGGIATFLCMREQGKVIAAKTAKGNRKAPKRFAGLIKLKPDMFDQYTQLHDGTWDEVTKQMYEANMRNFVVYYHEETSQMFHHWEYVGDDFAADMKKCSDNEMIKFWWSYCEPCQEPLHWEGPPPSQGGTGDWWSPMKCLNHCGAWPVAWATEFPDPDHIPQNPHRKISTSSNPPPVHNRNN